MRKTDVLNLCGLSLIVGFLCGVIISHEMSHYAGRMQERSQARLDAMTWAKEQIELHCPAWFTDRRAKDYMACRKPDWMHK